MWRIRKWYQNKVMWWRSQSNTNGEFTVESPYVCHLRMTIWLYTDVIWGLVLMQRPWWLHIGVSKGWSHYSHMVISLYLQLVIRGIAKAMVTSHGRFTKWRSLESFSCAKWCGIMSRTEAKLKGNRREKKKKKRNSGKET